MRAYILTFDKGGWLDGFDYVSFHKKLINDPSVIDWWHYLDNSYILIADHRIQASYFANIYNLIGNNKFAFICELNLHNCNGWLPPDAWKWIKKVQERTTKTFDEDVI